MSQSKFLILIVGFPGSGKTTLSRTLGRALGVTVLDKDIIRDTCVSCGFNYEEVGDLSYEILLALTRAHLQLDLSVILDSASTKTKRRHEAFSLAEELEAVFCMIECVCSNDVELRRRIEMRVVPKFRVDNWPKYEQVVSLYEPYAEPRLIVNTLRPIEENVAEVLAYFPIALEISRRSQKTKRINDCYEHIPNNPNP